MQGPWVAFSGFNDIFIIEFPIWYCLEINLPDFDVEPWIASNSQTLFGCGRSRELEKEEN